MLTLICPGCSKAGKAPPDFLGKHVKCRHCGHRFLAQAGGDAADDPPKIPLVGRTDYENFTFGIGGDQGLAERAAKAGYFTGFRQLPMPKEE